MTADPFLIVIYHNPDCGTSRNTLAMIRAAGYEPEVVEYLNAGWTEVLLRDLLHSMNVRPRDILRKKATPAADLGLMDPEVSDQDVIRAMVAYPVLVNRPIVRTPLGVALCRPSEAVFALLDQKPVSFSKEDGEIVSP